jgi:hypothetical protein
MLTKKTLSTYNLLWESHRADCRMSTKRIEPLELLYARILQWVGWNSAEVITSAYINSNVWIPWQFDIAIRTFTWFQYWNLQDEYHALIIQNIIWIRSTTRAEELASHQTTHACRKGDKRTKQQHLHNRKDHLTS